jgi:hypothetical protein
MCCTCRDVHKEFKKRGYSVDQLQAGLMVCRPCHSAIHRAVPDNKQLAMHYSTAEALSQVSSGLFCTFPYPDDKHARLWKCELDVRITICCRLKRMLATSTPAPASREGALHLCGSTCALLSATVFPGFRSEAAALL